MSHISAHVSLRPIRLGFVVRPDDKASALEIFRINTCLWGGKFNPIIPFFKQIPKWWDRQNHKFDSATQIINGYLDFFEPDFLVEAEPGIAEGISFDKKRVLQLTDILALEDDRANKGCGLNVLDIYKDLYRKEFQFARRHDHNISDIHAETVDFQQFAACVFGAFPTTLPLKYLHQAFTDAFEPKKTPLNANSLTELYRSGNTSALRLGHSNIDVQYHDHSDPALFILDSQKSRDLIDFWNLRAIKKHVIPIPVQWITELSDFCKEFIGNNYRPLPGNNHGVMIQPIVMFSRSIATADIARIHADHVHVDVPGANVLQDWYPQIWRPSPGFMVRQMRASLSASIKTFDVSPTESAGIRFDCLHPDFAQEYGNKNRWANVVRLDDWTFTNQIATTFPCDYRHANFPRLRIGNESPLSTTEGLVIFPTFKNISEHWDLSDGTTAISNWLKIKGVTAVVSDAGRSTQQIIQTLGGFRGVSSLARAEIVRFLNKISRREISRSSHHQEFKNGINNAVKGDIWSNRNFETLVERNVVELGLKLKCTKCSSWSWYSLKQLDYQLVCELCLRQFGFPVGEPQAIRNWAYRLIGPFALPDYAKGGYAAALSIRFFSEIIGNHGRGGVTWSAGQELELAPLKKVEADFILWNQRKGIFGNDYFTEVVFGETKSFGRDVFQADDIEKMKALAIRFPGSILVFSTMKEASELSRQEIGRIAKLAMWGREYVREKRQTRAPVIILTGTELFAPFSLDVLWKDIGGRHAEMISHGLVRTESLRVLADITQQLYLDMPSYGSWRMDKHQRKLDAIRVRKLREPA